MSAGKDTEPPFTLVTGDAYLATTKDRLTVLDGSRRASILLGQCGVRYVGSDRIVSSIDSFTLHFFGFTQDGHCHGSHPLSGRLPEDE